MKVKSLSHVQLFGTPWTVAYQAPPSMGFSRQENWSGLPFPSPGNLPDPGIKPGSPALEADALTSEPPGKPYFNTHKYSKEHKQQMLARMWGKGNLVTLLARMYFGAATVGNSKEITKKNKNRVTI